MKFPTILGKQLLDDMITVRLLKHGDSGYAIASFQRMAAVTDFDTAIKALIPWLKPEHRVFAGSEKARLLACYEITKNDILGHAIDEILAIMSGTGASKDKLAAAAIINELYGERHLIEDGVLTDKLVVNLIGDN